MENLNLFLHPVQETAVVPIEDKSLLTVDKSELSEIASKIVEAVDDGIADALNTLIMAKKGAYVFDSIIESMKGKARLPEGKSYQKHNCDIREQATGVRYYFDACNDPIWSDLNMQLLDLKERLSKREAKLKTFTKPTAVQEEVDEDTGEVIMEARVINPPVKTGGQSLIFTIK
ncbi:hypothetical protein [Mucilaginibacter sp. SP1R1]|uniref:hypothetical protein n=1 Tax=Mucilaginibacter sp. SP1R1 TaxID=2723091 RepID=UPI001608ED0F|nr:hypothetical protein [Mucilaginibacter sp. SP1R1]MBB6152285.1 hypothetical protein [Mucilaginibacter sp. SP1R1]